METLRVATFNCRHGLDLDGRVDIDRTAEIVASLGADVIALQELDRNLPRSGRTDQIGRLEEITGYSLAFSATVRMHGGEYGLAIATRHRLTAEFEALPRLRDEEPRTAIVARFGRWSIVATHLSTSFGARRAQTKALARLAAGLDPPVVLMGDFNQGRLALRFSLGPGWSFGRRRSTHRLRQVDHVCARGARVVGTEVPQTQASDHHPLIVELRA